MKKKYTVLLLMPDYSTSDFGSDTFLIRVEAKTPKEAVKAAREAASKDEEINDPSDLHVLALFAGHCESLMHTKYE